MLSVIGQFGEAVGVMLFYRVGEAFEHRAVEKSRSQIMEAVDLRPETVLLDENGTVREVPAGSAVVGNIVADPSRRPHSARRRRCRGREPDRYVTDHR